MLWKDGGSLIATKHSTVSKWFGVMLTSLMHGLTCLPLLEKKTKEVRL